MATGNDIIALCNTVVNDDGTKWGQNVWVEYINNGQTFIAEIFPDAFTAEEILQLVKGAVQSCPLNALRFMSLRNNYGTDGLTPGPAITLVEEETLAAFLPNWPADSNAGVLIENYLFDENLPTSFKVSPPAPASPPVFVSLTYAKAPVPLVNSTDNLGIPDRFVPALAEYCLYMALSAETDVRDPGKAVSHLTTFYNLLGVKSKNRTKYSPNVHEFSGNPPKDLSLS